MPLTIRHHDASPAVPPAEIRAVWLHYLRVTREAAPEDYRLVEERAWNQLASNLAALGAPLAEPERTRDP